MDTAALPTKDRLIRAAAKLFRTHGYHGVGLNDLLSEAAAPKGSLYHHFPNGKADLAIAAATWASDEMLRVIAASFAEAETFEDGATTLCFKLAKLFDLTGQQDGCPIGSTLFEGPGNAGFLEYADRCYSGWIAEVHDHASRFGLDAAEAGRRAEHLFLLIQGGWQLARARRSSDVLRSLPALLEMQPQTTIAPA
ncbi:TetR/AcrR family transcriptional regulator [Roseobacter sinensis]|uniref:TetR/AcrR family transcriptional regulator n=1 Tax=Roseobacter sinensis TaxID=2931391 RepID=A0ABT3BDR9_9RHOB|nr:TetR/AcrR family transcriptional regulator [Roseobacter sp. WL0113]MCV3271720.1 TetR/AcrR family transcriptional regulator [Roseobacter sp. WL0113]